MDIPITTDEKKFYRQALTIVSNIPPFNKLRTKELEALAWLSYYFNDLKYEFGEQKIDEINRRLFDYDVRLKIREQIQDKHGSDLSPSNLSNLFRGLKAKGFILDNQGRMNLNTKYLFDPRKVDEITFKFHFNEQ